MCINVMSQAITSNYGDYGDDVGIVNRTLLYLLTYDASVYVSPTTYDPVHGVGAGDGDDASGRLLVRIARV